MMISCEKATILCNKTQYGEASFLEKLQLKFHLFMCKTCSSFSKKNTELTSLCQKANLNGLSTSEKEQMKTALQKKD